MVHVIAKCSIQPTKIEEFLTMADELVKLTRKEEGCIRYDLCSSEEENVFFFIEDWQDKSRLDAHFQTEHFTRIVGQIQEIKSAELEVQTLESMDKIGS